MSLNKFRICAKDFVDINGIQTKYRIEEAFNGYFGRIRWLPLDDTYIRSLSSAREELAMHRNKVGLGITQWTPLAY